MPAVADHYASMSALIGSDPNRLGTNFLWLGDLQKNVKRPLYVDRLHYTAEFSAAIADRVGTALERQVQERSALPVAR